MKRLYLLKRIRHQQKGTGSYLAPYLFRVAISNNRILKRKDGIKYKDSDTGNWRLRTLSAED